MNNRWTAKDIPDQTGRVAIVTGANSGLGYETSLALARKNATVIMTSRSMTKGEKARDEVLAQAPNAQVEVMQLDLSSLDSVRSFAENFRAKYDRLDMLINNAGIMGIPRGETADGFEIQLGVNHLGHFALTGLLIDLIIQTPDSRVVSVSSGANYMGTINFDDLMGENEYTRYGSYSQSKLANIVFANGLQKRLEQAGVSTISLSAHPGYSNTNLQGNSTDHSGSTIERILYPITNRILAQSQAMGALPQLFAATAPEAKGCDFIGPNFFNMRGYPKKVRANEEAYNEAIADRLWEVSEDLTGVRYEALNQQTVAMSKSI